MPTLLLAVVAVKMERFNESLNKMGGICCSRSGCLHETPRLSNGGVEINDVHREKFLAENSFKVVDYSQILKISVRRTFSPSL